MFGADSFPMRGPPRRPSKPTSGVERTPIAQKARTEEHLGLKREMVARIYRELMIDMYGRLEVAYGAPNPRTLLLVAEGGKTANSHIWTSARMRLASSESLFGAP
jgi:hypothetical protein